MALPKLDNPVYNITIPSTKKKVRYRPFLVKEEKILMMARESKKTQDQITAIKQIINNCILDEIDIDTLTSFDLEFIFINLRAKSVGETIEVVFTCPKCGGKSNTEVDLSKTKMSSSGEIQETIKLTPTIGMKMKYPSIDEIVKAEKSSLVDIVISCLEYIYDDKTTYPVSEYTKEDLNEFLESLTFEQLRGVEEFFDNMPKLVYDESTECPLCGETVTQKIEGITNFF